MTDSPATSVKRWEEGVSPQKVHLNKIVLVLGLGRDPDSIYYQLGRDGISIEKKHWDAFSGLIKSANNSIMTTKVKNLPNDTIDGITGAIVAGTNGLLALIAKALFEQKSNIKTYKKLKTIIASILS